MKTTKTLGNILKAKELLEIRDSLKQLKKRETELKEYFADLMQDDTNLLVGTAISISKHTQTRKTWDSKGLTSFFESNHADADDFKKTTVYTMMKLNA